MMLRNLTKHNVVANHLVKAESLCSRMKGLLGHEFLPAGHGLWIKNSGSIHTFFMKFAIDVVFVDERLKVRGQKAHVPAWRLVVKPWGARDVFELPAGTIATTKLEVGDLLNVVD